jgi:DNA repair ATPase RecN
MLTMAALPQVEPAFELAPTAADLLPRVASLTTRITGLKARKDAVDGQLTLTRRQMASLETRKALLVKTNAVLDQLIQKVAEKGIGRVETVVTSGLNLVFGPKVSCVLEKKEGARGTSYKIKIKVSTDDGDVIGDPMTSFGGGPVNVTSFLLRVLMLHRFKLARLMVLDETFNNVSQSYLPAVADLLNNLATDYGYNILAITHQPELAARAKRTYRVGGEIGSPTLKLLSVGEEA